MLMHAHKPNNSKRQNIIGKEKILTIDYKPCNLNIYQYRKISAIDIFPITIARILKKVKHKCI